MPNREERTHYEAVRLIDKVYAPDLSYWERVALKFRDPTTYWDGETIQRMAFKCFVNDRVFVTSYDVRFLAYQIFKKRLKGYPDEA